MKYRTCDASNTTLCGHLGYLCYNHDDCCSQYCSKSFWWSYGICDQDQSSLEFDLDSNLTAQEGICEFHMQIDENDNDYLNDEFSIINAAHNTLPPYTLIKVSYKRRSIVISINDRIPKTNGTLLDLSNEAALRLHIKNEEFVPCKIEKVMHHNPILKMILYSIPVLLFFIVIVNL
ncbi:uncharacterized protein LOC112596430 isoform X2 [Melanaphis sacchari]|uniref:uncharacterized protein LOC112596430 isoform X2 n=1 Tax=Melanaphis sacchari TaxID=742174 RepID=UPI000DC14016|nr:uncharacterized protein LOC112596430 isoform X2 [Melanaphis sacchari]